MIISDISFILYIYFTPLIIKCIEITDTKKASIKIFQKYYFHHKQPNKTHKINVMICSFISFVTLLQITTYQT